MKIFIPGFLFLAGSCFTDASIGSLRSPLISRNDDSLPLRDLSASSHWIICGGAGARYTSIFCGESEIVPDNKKVAVSCCSDLYIADKFVVKNSGCSVYGSSRIEYQGLECHLEKSYAEAKDICTSAGGRLCTVQEIQAGCIEKTGCPIRRKMVWSSTTCPEDIPEDLHEIILGEALLDEPLLDVPIDVRGLLQSCWNDVAESAGVMQEGIRVQQPQWNCKSKYTNIASMGKIVGVSKCEEIDYLDDAEVVVFGWDELIALKGSDSAGACAAINPTTGIFAVAHSGLPPIEIIDLIQLSPTSVSVSIDRQLSLTSHNKMWDGDTTEIMKFFGHFLIKADTTMGFKMANKKVNFVFSDKIALLVDADPEENGITNPFQASAVMTSSNDAVLPGTDMSSSYDLDNNFARRAGESFLNDLDFAIFFQAQITPTIELVTKTKTYELDFWAARAVSIDFYLKYTASDSQLLSAGQMKLTLESFCQGPLEIVCVFFDSGSSLDVNMQLYASNTAFSLNAGLEGQLSFGTNLSKTLGNLVDTDFPSINFNGRLDIILELEGDDFSVCASDSESFAMCLVSCNNHDGCDMDSFCEPTLKICLPKRPNWVAAGCHTSTGNNISGDRMCQSGICDDYLCQPCRNINMNDSCGSNMHCALISSTDVPQHYCASNKNNGETCVQDDECQSSICIKGACQPCRNINMNDVCGNDMHCAMGIGGGSHYCANNKDFGEHCVHDDECHFSTCIKHACQKPCHNINMKDNCGSDMHCAAMSSYHVFRYYCTNGKNLGESCVHDDECIDSCDGRFCIRRCRSHSDCPSNKNTCNFMGICESEVEVQCSQRPALVTTHTPGSSISITTHPLLEGVINVKDEIKSLWNEVVSTKGSGVLLPDWNCRSSNVDIATMAKRSNVSTCKQIDFLDETEVIVFGLELDGNGYCAAMNFSTLTFAIAETVLPPIKILEVIHLKPTSIGVSINRELALTSRNKMWDGNTKEIKKFFGHIIVKAETSIGLELANKKVNVIIKNTMALLVDADPQNDGIQNPFISSPTNDLDFAFFFQAQIIPEIELVTQTETFTLDFSQAIQVNIDLYAKFSTSDTQLQFSGQMNLSLDGFCKGPLAVVCEFFGAKNDLSVNIQVNANNGGFDLYAGLKGSLSFGDKLLDKLGDVVKDTLPSIDFNAELGITLKLKDDNISVCANGGTGSETFNMCLGFCKGHSDCDKESFCEPILQICLPKRPNKIPFGCFHDNRMCESNICVDTACQECRNVNTNDECGTDRHCALDDLGFNRKCINDKARWSPCTNSDECKDELICSLLTCQSADDVAAAFAAAADATAAATAAAEAEAKKHLCGGWNPLC
mmetsp:Transcript_39116/g.76298  ORF Transcript_39116/g.76298 Transcript_39116/m.76298 type:complete len:1346 (+) Transcript_39116:232-4269(+)